MRTAFNLLGPLVNPANPTVQVVGAPSLRSAELIAEALATLGLKRGYVVHGLDGLDEVTTTGETRVLEIRGGAIAEHTLSPEDFGVPVANPEDLKGADKNTNREIALEVLGGGLGPKRDIVLVNASVALVAAGRAESFAQGMRVAAEAVDSGRGIGEASSDGSVHQRCQGAGHSLSAPLSNCASSDPLSRPAAASRRCTQSRELCLARQSRSPRLGRETPTIHRRGTRRVEALVRM
jgi:hypothetical protein